MKIGLTVWNGWISPVFDVCREALVLEIDDGDIVSMNRVGLDTATPLQKIERLVELGVDTLICGAISEAVHTEARHRGLTVAGFVTGQIDRVVQAFISGGLPTPEFSMPGCRGTRRRFRGGQNTGYCAGRGRGRKDKRNRKPQ